MTLTDRDYHKRKHLHAAFALGALVLLGVSIWALWADQSRPWKEYQQTFHQIRESVARWEGGDPPKRAPEKIHTIIPEGLTVNYNHKRVSRFDRCTSCHLGIDQSAHGTPGTARYPATMIRTFELSLDEQPAAAEADVSLESLFGFQLRQSDLLAPSGVRIESVLDADGDAPALAAQARPVDPAGVEEQTVESLQLAALKKDLPGTYFPPGLRVGDVILNVNDNAVTSLRECDSLLRAAVSEPSVKTVRITVRRGWPEPYSGHPRLDLFIGKKSPHPMADFGCTICHEGRGGATDFARARHSPDDLGDHHRWVDELGFSRDPKWPLPMYPRRFIEASCLQCHQQVVDLMPSERFPEPPAPRLVQGYDLVRRHGCFNCHEIDGFDALEHRVGPGLGQVGGAFRSGYLVDWIRDPQSVSPQARMPRAFGLHSHLTGEARVQAEEIEEKEILGIVAYLQLIAAGNMSTEMPPRLPEDARLREQWARGKRYFALGGCLACHKHEAFPEFPSEESIDLSGLWKKLRPVKGEAFLWEGMHDPEKMSPGTRMPTMTLRRLNEFKDAPTPPAADVVKFLASREKMGILSDEKYPDIHYADDPVLVEKGRKAIEKYACYACHEIPGFEDSRKIGPSLTDWARKQTSQLGFGRIDDYVTVMKKRTGAEQLEPFYVDALRRRTHAGFAFQKLTAPRSFDYGKEKEKPFDQRLRMNQFAFTPDEREAVATFLLGLVPPPQKRFRAGQSSRAQALIAGRELIERYNCDGCHLLGLQQVTLAMRPGEFPAPSPVVTFPSIEPHFTEKEKAASKRVDPGGNIRTVLSGRLRLQQRGLPQLYAWDQLENDFVPLAELEPTDRINPADLGFGMELWLPALADGRVHQSGSPLPIIRSDRFNNRLNAEGSWYTMLLARYLLKDDSKLTPHTVFGRLPPPLLGEGSKVRPEWLSRYLAEPALIRPAVQSDMPQFRLSEKERAIFVDYFLALDGLGPSREPEPVPVPDRRQMEKTREFVMAPDSCTRCHGIGSFTPDVGATVLAPNLADVHERLRPEYVHRWIAQPDWILPYTPMPVNIEYKPQPPEAAEQSIEDLDQLVRFLIHFNRYLSGGFSGKE